jgi:hypothetical protein
MEVDLQHAGIGSDSDQAEPVVTRRWVALKHDPGSLGSDGLLDGRDQADPVLELIERRKEDVKVPGSEFYAEGCGRSVAGFGYLGRNRRSFA